MTNTITADDLSERALQLLRENRDTSLPIMIEHDGTRLGVLISPEEYERFRKEQADSAWDAIQCVKDRNADKDLDTELEFITAIVDQVRQERREREQAATSRR